MDKVYERCCGVDVHKKMLVACLRVGTKQEVKEFGTTTKELREFADWLIQNQCEIVAMESTGSYWKPIYNVFELLDLNVIVVNAHHVKNVPGRKTDKKDAQWIAELLQHGLLKASYIPDKEQRDCRDVTRYRKNLVDERAREKNRLEKMLESSNIKLSSFVSDITGKSSRNLLNGMIEDNISKDTIDTMLYGKLKAKKEEILIAMDGVVSPVQKKLISAVLDHIDDMTNRIDELNNIIKDEMQKYEDAVHQLDAIPGIGETSAQIILAEIGLDMNRFPTDAHISSWAGLSPGNNESAGKRKSGKTTKGNKTLKTTLIQYAKTAVKNKDSYFHAQYERLVVRRAKSRATVAVVHSMLIAIYHMLKNQVPFKDLGCDYYNQFNPDKKIKAYLKKLEQLGWTPPTESIA